MTIKRINEFPDGSGTLTADDVFLFMDDPTNAAVTKKVKFSDISNIIGGGGATTTASISDFSTSVSGLIPVKNISPGSGISIAHVSGVYTINSLLVSDSTNIPGATSVRNIVQISQWDYNNLEVVDPNTLYIIT